MQRCKVLLISPAFPINTFWNIKATSKVAGARHSAIPLGLITVAAMLPAEWECRLIDRNVSELEEADLDWADMVMTGGMNVQRFDCLQVIERAHRRRKPVVVGGPDASSEPEVYAGADFVIVGEAETIIGDFIAAWEAGRRRGTFIAEKFKADVTSTPVPRFDLLHHGDYLYYAVQFSRGCPFNCEFCDIIELYGRVPRVKTAAQFLAELEVLYLAGYRGHLDFVDDNFIGNKKAVKAMLPALIGWQKEHGYPFWFSTEATINLADDDALLALMRAANFGIVFVGIESPDTATLVSMQKKQNTRRNLADSVQKIYAAGMIAIAGFIVGFDTEQANVSSQMIQCVDETSIPICMAGLLVALPNTQLSRRLEREGRLFPFDWLESVARDQGGDQCTIGLNFHTLRPRRDVLADYKRIIDAIYTPSAYFARARRVVEQLGQWPPHPTPFSAPAAALNQEWQLLGLGKAEWTGLARLLIAAARANPLIFFHVVKALVWTLRTRPQSLHATATFAAFYLHLGPFSRVVSASAKRQIDRIEDGRWTPPLSTPETSEGARTAIRAA
jgi:radical SAM superfamily enzyme YgiQ (UPF0313 family)